MGISVAYRYRPYHGSAEQEMNRQFESAVDFRLDEWGNLVITDDQRDTLAIYADGEWLHARRLPAAKELEDQDAFEKWMRTPYPESAVSDE